MTAGPAVMTSTASVLVAVRRALADAAGDPARLSALLPVAEALLHRSTIEDDLPRRRSDALARAVREAASSVPTGDSAAPSRGVVDADSDGAGIRLVCRRDEAIRILVDSDLPDTSAVEFMRIREVLATTAGASVPSVDAADVGAYLATRRGWSSPVVESVVRLEGGFSKETLLVAAATPSGRTQFVLRKNVASRPAGDLALEFQILGFVSAAGVPVADPLWLETDDASLGGSFFASARLPGRGAGDGFGPSEDVPAVAALDLARVLAGLHRLDVRQLDAPTIRSAVRRADLLSAVDEQRRHLQAAALAGEPGTEIYVALWHGVLDWLTTNAPDDADHAVLVHGDVGFHNLLLDEGRVVGLVDWEHAHLGQREEDLAYVRPRIDGLVSWDEFVAAYREAGGDAPNLDRMRFHAVWHDTRNGIAAMRLRAGFLREPERLSDAVAGMLLAPVFLRAAVRNAFAI